MDIPPADLLHYDPIFLLWCEEPMGPTSIAELSTLVGERASPVDDIRALAGDDDWRCHLVAGIAMVISEHGKNKELVEALWAAFDDGSWVSPQLAVCLEAIDPEFLSRARARIETGCGAWATRSSKPEEEAARSQTEHARPGPIGRAMKALAEMLGFRGADARDDEFAIREESARRHVARGPGGPLDRSAKAFSALLYLCGQRAGCEAWILDCRTESRAASLLAVDVDRGDRIARVWSAQFGDALSKFRYNLGD